MIANDDFMACEGVGGSTVYCISNTNLGFGNLTISVQEVPLNDAKKFDIDADICLVFEVLCKEIPINLCISSIAKEIPTVVEYL